MSLSVQSDISPDPDVTFQLLSITLRDSHKLLTSPLSGQAGPERCFFATAGQREEVHSDFRQRSGLRGERMSDNLSPVARIRDSSLGLPG